MIPVLMTPAQTATELRAEFDRWTAVYGKPPSLIVGHRLLVYDLARDPETQRPARGDWKFRGVPVQCMVEWWDANYELYGEKEPVDAQS